MRKREEKLVGTLTHRSRRRDLPTSLTPTSSEEREGGATWGVSLGKIPDTHYPNPNYPNPKYPILNLDSNYDYPK
jgi:hypothetical protein